MTWRLEVRHRTGYHYPRPVVASYNEARLTPQTTPEQLAIDARIEVQPAARTTLYWDYWGSLVHAFDIHRAHDELNVTAISTVETPDRHGFHGRDDLSWDDLARPSVTDRYYEFLAPSRDVISGDAFSDTASALRREAHRPAEAVDLVAAWTHDHLVYEKGSTTVSTSAVDALRVGRGVCQDFVHVSLSLLRGMGIPARYVSGYFHSEPEAGVGVTVVGESHAWAEAFIGGWCPFDPTNTVPVGERHVVVAAGRDYHDVVPLKGVYSGAPSSVPMVLVELTRRA